MKIDWFTFIAQILNFLVLMWLLKRFLYKPVLSAIDERENKIKEQLKDAESQEKEATKAKDEFNRKNETFDKQKDELMAKAAADAKTAEDKLKEKARNEANALKTKLEKAFTEDQASKNSDMVKRIGDEVLDMTRKTLIDLSSASLEKPILEVFLKRIHAIKDDEKKKFTAALKAGSNPILVQSAFALSKDQQAKIQKSVNGLLGNDATYKFDTVPELISGIALLANGYKLSWSISDYLKSMEDHMAQDKKAETETIPKSQ